VTLLDLDGQTRVQVRSLPPDAAAARRLQSLGIAVGRRIQFVRAAPFAGPILVEDQTTGARVMIARELAGHIQVGLDNDAGT
jgi:Fe2+ transport system protein FeoA